MSHIFKTLSLSLIGVTLSSTAYAGCNDTPYCKSHVEGWNGYARANTVNTYQNSTLNQNMSHNQYNFTGSVTSVPGLGQNESLRATSCPVNVYNPNHGEVLGCYNVVKPVAQTQYYRIIRPVIYIHYPVAVAGHSQAAHASASAHSEAWASSSAHNSHRTDYPSATRYGSTYEYASSTAQSTASAHSAATASVGNTAHAMAIGQCPYRCG